MKRLTLMLAMLAVSGVASAALMVEVDQAPLTFEGVDYIQFTVRIVGTEGDVMGGFDGRFDGPMNQLWPGGGTTPTVTNNSPLGGPLTDIMPPEQVAADTHLLLTAGELVATGSLLPAENNDGSGGLLPKVDPPQQFVGSVWGLGSYLANSPTNAMAFGIEDVARTDNLYLAQIVVPVGQQVAMTGVMADQAGIKTMVDEILVPEPATMAMLGLGGALALIRRRRRGVNAVGSAGSRAAMPGAGADWPPGTFPPGGLRSRRRAPQRQPYRGRCGRRSTC